MPFCSALFLKTAIKAAEIFEHLIILSRGLAPSGPLSFCQSFPCVFLHAAEINVFSKVRVCAAYPKYGVQKGWERVTSPETGAENFSEITDSEAQQLGFPF